MPVMTATGNTWVNSRSRSARPRSTKVSIRWLMTGRTRSAIQRWSEPGENASCSSARIRRWSGPSMSKKLRPIASLMRPILGRSSPGHGWAMWKRRLSRRIWAARS